MQQSRVSPGHCLPILLCADSGDEFAAIHAGWRGLAAGIVTTTLSRMDTPPARLLAWLGPAISQPAFEVGDEVRAAFVAAGRWQADLYALAGRMLGAAGVDAVYGGGLCTFGDAERFFSYRRDGQCGRMASFVARRR
jgi:YfiH family protein